MLEGERERRKKEVAVEARQGEVRRHSGCGHSSLEAVQDLALHAMLDLAPPQHELQDLVDGVLWVLL